MFALEQALRMTADAFNMLNKIIYRRNSIRRKLELVAIGVDEDIGSRRLDSCRDCARAARKTRAPSTITCGFHQPFLCLLPILFAKLGIANDLAWFLTWTPRDFERKTEAP